jgi:hypothetical protein
LRLRLTFASRASDKDTPDMKLEGSCHCRRVRFTVESDHEIPYQRCYCSICRKTSGGGGWTVNLAADARTLSVTGRRFTRTYHARLDDDPDPAISPAERVFCASCGSALWLYDPGWPELLHPFASAIDTPLPVPPTHTHLMLGARPDWVEVEGRRGDRHFDQFPEESIAEWHARVRGSAP